MKRVTLLLVLLSAFSLNALTLLWNPQPEAESFNVYWKTNIADPWVMRTNTTTTNVTFALPPGIYFFTVTASNFWGESGFSSVAQTPSPANSVSNLSIHRTP